ERNKRSVIEFYDLMFNQCRPRPWASTSGPHIPSTTRMSRMGDARSLPTSSVWPENTPASTFGSFGTLRRETTWSCTAIRCGPVDRTGLESTYFILRLDSDGKVVEHWDVLQTIPDQAANGNGMF